jgi:hypothetical protein
MPAAYPCAAAPPTSGVRSCVRHVTQYLACGGAGQVGSPKLVDNPLPAMIGEGVSY